jgi:hypothetical protein
LICGNDSCAGELTVWEMGMQVIASKDTEIEDLRKRLVATEKQQAAELQQEEALAKQLAEAKRKEEELEANLNKSKV